MDNGGHGGSPARTATHRVGRRRRDRPVRRCTGSRSSGSRGCCSTTPVTAPRRSSRTPSSPHARVWSGCARRRRPAYLRRLVVNGCRSALRHRGVEERWPASVTAGRPTRRDAHRRECRDRRRCVTTTTRPCSTRSTGSRSGSARSSSCATTLDLSEARSPTPWTSPRAR